MTTNQNTFKNISLLIMRLALGIVIFPHGAQKLLGWFGGYGFDGTMNYFTSSVGIPYIIGLLVIIGESFGAIAIILGLFGRFSAASLFIIILGALYFDHAQHGFFMNWFGNQKGEGYEFDLLTFGLSIPLLLQGSGAYSLDAVLERVLKRRERSDLASV
ncbi:DoxX family protein [Chryseosolibacter indicus]|uniref:DoxX family protein n=1 Tax=Chryseosolibacter indicus TaxID=2782351 RepID=A0ABS5VMT1_9BACT|nr:DoxX family protein [Chryseosolibacter indicus]MBT1702760.1 DoxX family protein [Chryseosolibacter indicus]